MGFSIRVTGPSPRVFQKLATDPSTLFPDPYAGYLLFLFNDVDSYVERWFVDNARSLDALTGQDVAFAFVAQRTHYRVHTETNWHAGARDLSARRQFEYGVNELPNSFHVDRLVKSGRFGWVNDGDEIVARNDGVYALARRLRITHMLPCVIVFDGIPSPDSPMVVLPLSEAGLTDLYQRIRAAVGELQAHPGFSEYVSGLHSIHGLTRRISELEERQDSIRLRNNEGQIDATIAKLHAALRRGNRRRFAAALNELCAYGIDRRADCQSIDWPRLRSLQSSIFSLRRYADSEWPLPHDDLERVQYICDTHVRPLLGDGTSSATSESAAAVRQTVAKLEAQHVAMIQAAVACLPASEEQREMDEAELRTIDDQRLALEHRLLTETRRVLSLPDRPSFCELLRDSGGKRAAPGRGQDRVGTGGAESVGARAGWLDRLSIGELISWLRGHNVFGFLQLVLDRTEASGGQAFRAPAAFVSYATPDRIEVLRRVHGIRAWQPGLDIFVDFHSLYAGEFWRERIVEEIRKRDRFLLFWSRAARDSKEVEFEWRVALAEHGIGAITPVPLQPPDEVEPPAELAVLHFNDCYLEYLRYARFPELDEQAYSAGA